MSTTFVTHHLYPDNPQFFLVDVRKVVKFTGEPRTSFWQQRRGEHFWEIVIYTSGLDSGRSRLGPYWIDTVSTEEDISEIINNKISEICNLIDWSIIGRSEDEVFSEQQDKNPPVIHSCYPEDGQIDVPIDSRIIIRIRDLLPAQGVDTSSIKMYLDGFEIIPEVSGNKYDCVVSYKPLIGES
jgi:hypothetical protein